MSFSARLYNTVFRRNSVFVGTVFAGAFLYDMAFHKSLDNVFDSLNQGKQWKDIKSKYVQAGDDDAEDDDE